MAKMREIKRRRYTRLTVELYRMPTFKLYFPDEEDHPLGEDYERDWDGRWSSQPGEEHSPEPRVIRLPGPHMLAGDYPTDGETKAVLRKFFAHQRRERRNTGMYPQLQTNRWVPEAVSLELHTNVYADVSGLRQVGKLLQRQQTAPRAYKKRMGGALKFFHPLGVRIDQTAAKKNIKADAPAWIKRLQQDPHS